ncbi:MAG: RNA polymerase sporulation sigma factor SigK [Bacilli bacterium]
MIKKLIEKFFKKSNGVFYVGASDILPPPLKKDEESKYIDLSSSGDRAARNILIEHNLRLVVFLAKKYDNTKHDLEDLVSIGTIGLIKGVKTYKSDKNIKLATYVSRCIDNEILMFLRKNKKKKIEVSFEDSINLDADGNELHLEDVLGTDPKIIEKDYEDKVDKNILLEELSKLNQRDQEIMILRYGLKNTQELTQREVAEKLSISQSYISRIEKKVIKRLKTLMKV